ncbi:MAG: hypothetical protein ACREON_01990 [Gemmatimonadaceae bacterium]
MIALTDLDQIAAARVEDAKVLLTAARFDSALYVCGYAVELALKARIRRTLHWPGFPMTRKEFEGYSSFRTHDLDVLLHLCGREVKIRQNHFFPWSAVALWSPDARYRSIGSVTQGDARAMITATAALLKVL